MIYAQGNRAIWGSRTDGKPPARLVLQDDGNLVMYAEGHRATWSSGTDKGGNGGVSGVRARIVNAARGEIGQVRSKEGAGNCNWYSGQVSSYVRSTCPLPGGYTGRGEAWCAQFVRWVYKQAGANNYTRMDAGARSVMTGNSDWHTGSGLAGVRPGDMVGFRLFDKYSNGRLNTDNDHVGIVVKVSGNQVTTVEGNTSAGAVKSVDHHTRGWSQISGYASPTS